MRFTSFGLSVVGLLLAASAQAATFSDTFETPPNTVGSTPVNYVITGTSATSTGNVATDGSNQFLALRDADTGVDINASRSFAGSTTGLLKFDIRFNGGLDSPFNIEMTSGPYEPIRLTFFSIGYDPNGPFYFGAEGVLYQYPTPVSQNVWHTISVNFDSTASGGSGSYTVQLDNTAPYTTAYLNQGGTNLAIDRVFFGDQFTNQHVSVDLDNVVLLPEPASAALLSVAPALLALRSRRSC
jgi:hypothetical protein